MRQITTLEPPDSNIQFKTPAEVLKDEITEEIVTSPSNWLNGVDSIQVYDRPRRDELPFDRKDTLAIRANHTPEVIEDIARVENNQEVSYISEVVEITTEMLTIMPEPWAEPRAESLDVTREIEGLTHTIEMPYETDEGKIISDLLIYMFSVSVKDADKDGWVIDSRHNSNVVNPLGEQLKSTQNLFEVFTDYLEMCETDVRDQAVELISSISEAVEELKGSGEEVDVELKAKLEQKIHELFATFGIEIEDEQAHKYIELLLLMLDKGEAITPEYNIEYLNKMGTREYKPSDGSSLLGRLIQTIGNQLNKIELIGKYTTLVCLA